MLASYFNITVIAEWCTFIAALFLLNKKTGLWRLFIIQLFLILCAETVGWLMKVRHYKFGNALPFNLLMIITTVFYILFFCTSQTMKHAKKILLPVSIFYLIAALINMIFFQKPNVYNSYTESFGDIIIIITCCYFLFINVRSEEYINLVSYEYFWFTIGILFSSLGSVLIYFFLHELYAYYLKTGINAGSYINYTVNIILYASLIIAFICRRIIMK